MQNVAQSTTYDLLQAARVEALKSRKYNFEETGPRIIQKFTEVFDGKKPYDWQVDACEALLFGLYCIVIAGTGAGKTFLFAMPLLMDTTCRKMVVVISPLNALEYDQVHEILAFLSI